MNGDIKLLSQIFKIYFFLQNFGKYSMKILFSKIFEEIFKFKKGIYVIEPNQVYMCTKCQVDILKNYQLMAF